MAKKIILVIVILLIGFLGFVSSKNSEFHYEKSGVINAPADKIYPYLSDFNLGMKWSPYEQMDPSMKSTFEGTPGQPGHIQNWEGKESGSGKIEIVKVVPNESVELKLTMLKPFVAENVVIYKLTPEGTGTRFSWSMSGDSGFIGKLMMTFIDCEKMVTADWDKGIQNLKTLIESTP